MASQRTSVANGPPLRNRTITQRSEFLAWCRAHAVVCFVILSGSWVCLLYRHALAGAFVYDDVGQIQHNVALTSWAAISKYFGSAQHFNDALRGTGGTFYRPLFWASLIVDRHLWGLASSGFHFTNLVLHWANGFVAFLLLRRLGASLVLAASSVLVWLGLPINSESVAWISGRAYCLCALFLLLGLLTVEWYSLSRRTLILVGYGGVSLAALLSHELGIVAPPLALLTAYVGKRLRVSWIPICAVSFVTDAIYFALRHHAGATGPESFAILPVGITFVKYLGWMVLPVHMSIERSTDFPANAMLLGAIGAQALFVAAVSAIVIWRSRRPEVTVGVVWMVIALAPFSGIVFLYQGLAERYTYVASLGLAVALVGLASRAGKQARRFLGVILCIWMFWGMWRLNARVLEWGDEAALYRSSLEVNPNSAILLFNLGVLSERAGDFERAAIFYQRSSCLNSSYAAPVAGLGNVHFARGNVRQAIVEYRRAAALDPYNVTMRVNLGAALLRTGALTAAEREYELAISMDPKRDEAYSNLGVVLFQEGKPDAAIDQFTRAITINPLNRNAYLNMGSVYQQEGDFSMAASMFMRGEQITPQNRDQRSFIVNENTTTHP
jgi:protein O-mannosyl-transferase